MQLRKNRLWAGVRALAAAATFAWREKGSHN